MRQLDRYLLRRFVLCLGLSVGALLLLSVVVDLIERARQAGHHVMIGGACTEHEGSMLLSEKLGFERVGTFKQVGYKFDRWLDVTYVQLVL